MKMFQGVFAGVLLVGLSAVSSSATAKEASPTLRVCTTYPDGIAIVDGTMWITPGGSECEDVPVGGGGGGEPSSGEPSMPPGGGGGGGVDLDRNKLPELPISAKLKCAMDNYLHPDVKGRTMKNISAWAFGKQNANGYWDYKYRSTNVSPGAGWVAVGGQGYTGYAWGWLYNASYQAHSNFPRTGTAPDITKSANSLSGAISAFEMSLFDAGHESGHLFFANLDEKKADWYGIDAVLRYRGDKGAKCPN
jgi:hypothetical protein